MKEISFFGTLPPLKQNVYYCVPFLKALVKKTDVHFISIKKLYPEFLYPGGKLEDNTFEFNEKEYKNLDVKRIPTYANPLSWIYTGLKVRNKIFHIQWWGSLPLFPMFFTIAFITKIRGIKNIITVHNIQSHEKGGFLYRFLNNLLYNVSEHFIVHSLDNKKVFCEVFKIKEEDVSVIPMGIHDSYIQRKISKEEARKELGFTKDDFIIFNFGSIREYKGVDVLIKAFAIASKENKNAKLVIAGKPWIDFKEYEKLILDLNVKDKVHLFLDYVPMNKVESFYAACDLFVLPYKFFDAQSGPGNIALAFNKPIIVTNVGGLPDLVKDKEAVVEKDNFNEMGKIILKVSNDKNLLKKLEEDSKELSEYFSWDSIADETIELYKKLSSVN